MRGSLSFGSLFLPTLAATCLVDCIYLEKLGTSWLPRVRSAHCNLDSLTSCSTMQLVVTRDYCHILFLYGYLS
jgi:hypothetical protein